MEKYLFILTSILLLAGCNAETGQYENSESDTQLVSVLSITIQPDSTGIDTAAIAHEIQGLIGLMNDLPRREYEVHATSLSDSLLTLSINPPIDREIQENMSQIFDTLVAHPSPFSPFTTSLKVTEQRKRILDLLELKSGSTYPLRLARYQAEWAYIQKDSRDFNQFINSSYVITYLRYNLIKPLPSLTYTYQAGKKGAGELRKAANRIYNTLGPLTAGYKIQASNPQVEVLWDSLRSQHRLLFARNKVQFRWATIDFEIEEFSPILHADTLLQTSIDKLVTAKPYVFHILIAPELSRSIKGYHFKQDKTR